MTRKQNELLLIAAGAALLVVGDKSFEEHGRQDTLGGTLASVAGVGLGAYGLYCLDRGWGQVAALGLGGLALWNAVKRTPGEPLVSLGPLHFPKALRG